MNLESETSIVILTLNVIIEQRIKRKEFWVMGYER